MTPEQLQMIRLTFVLVMDRKMETGRMFYDRLFVIAPETRALFRSDMESKTQKLMDTLAMAIATFKVGTRRTIFSFYLFVVIYLVGGFFLDRLDFFHFDVRSGTSTVERSKTSWLTGMHPFLALQTFTDKDYKRPEFGSLPENLQSWPVGWYLSSPQTFYPTFMFLLSAALIVPSALPSASLPLGETVWPRWSRQTG